MTIEYRRATPADSDAIAALHADSWRHHYRGAHPDSYLDGDVLSDRRTVWGERLSDPDADAVTIVAEDGGAVVGFAHVILDADDEFGALLDNLHVRYALKGGGLGTRLMAETARAVLDARRGSGLYLRVLEQNTPAQAFYDARGGQRIRGEPGSTPPGGGERPYVFVYAWPDPSTLLID